MTVIEQIIREAESLSTKEQRQALSLVRALRSKGTQRKSKTAARRKKYVPKDPAVRAIAGLWKDRTDLPKDPVEAVKVLRERMASRRRDG